MMELRRHNVKEQLFELTQNTPTTRLMFSLRDYAQSLLATDYPREQLLEDFERVRAVLREREEEREDAVMEVMDFLYGWCSPHMKL